MYRANINHSQKILDILGNTTQATDMLIKLKNPGFYLFLSDSGKSLLSWEPVFGQVPWYLVHTFTDPDERGIDLKRFLLETGIWMIENTNATAAMAVIPRKLRRYGIFLAQAVKAKRLGRQGDCTVYTFGDDRYEELKKELKQLTT